MSTPEAQAIQPSTPTGPMIRTLMGIAMLSGFLVVLTYQLTKPIIAENQRRAIETAVFQVIPGAVARRDFLVTESAVTPVSPDGPTEGVLVYAGYDQQGNLKGVAAKAGAQGYADMIHLLYGYDPDCECVRGIKVLKLAETPGLGDKIITDANFVANFDALEAKLNAAGDALANEIVTVKAGTKQNPWEIDAISGATISAKAVGKALNQSTQQLLPQLMPHIDVIRNAPPPPSEPETPDNGTQ
ncbi:MAG: FMN-binding protein [gamma proteobacterium symbiont of Stewartia floridana]|nr:MAG: FMN-binding protein [gamma proteobacterium symbiont of Stewartia floridana]RLW64107.1 MAG: FMN-binding protein [gamma proteobacterium symbiont of Stewartia floridana]RLW64765.1 MAG: FMN-binding protein [gamma proteobacterium symbiont of Stewartia floridana]